MVFGEIDYRILIVYGPVSHSDRRNVCITLTERIPDAYSPATFGRLVAGYNVKGGSTPGVTVRWDLREDPQCNYDARMTVCGRGGCRRE